MRVKRLLNTEEVSLEINIKKLFGKTVNDSALQRSIAESLIGRILDRTSKGKGVDGNGYEVKLKGPYSTEYVDSLEFKAFDKSKNKINMKLTGSMLSSVDLISATPEYIRIGIDNEDAPKAFNHMTGDTPNMPVRPFLGLTDDDLQSVRKEFEPAIKGKISAADIFDASKFAKIANLFKGSGRFGFEQ